MNPNASMQEAANLLRRARRVLIYTGAGMSADSGVPTYRDPNGRWRDFTPFTSKGLDPASLNTPNGYANQPQHAWAYAEYFRRVVKNAPLHDGYHVIRRWVTQSHLDAFVLTSNIDGMHLRSNIPEVKLYEQYGSQWELQCTQKCRPVFWTDSRSPLCMLDESTMTASEFPVCPFCEAIARPRVQMSEDRDYIEREYDWLRYDRWRSKGPIDVAVVIGTFQWLSWPDTEDPRPHIININTDPSMHQKMPGSIGITMKAQEALVSLDREISEEQN
jgi:NAD-dependent SIR2 family protein deacetylase